MIYTFYHVTFVHYYSKKNFNYDYRACKPDYVPAQWVLNLFDANDGRKNALFGENAVTTGYSHGLTWPLLYKYWGNQDFISQQILHTSMPKVFRLSEQYLIRAEVVCCVKTYICLTRIF